MRTFAMITMVYYVWLMFGNSLYHRATSFLDDNAKIFGGSTDADDRSVLAAKPAFDKWKDGKNSTVGVVMENYGS